VDNVERLRWECLPSREGQPIMCRALACSALRRVKRETQHIISRALLSLQWKQCVASSALAVWRERRLIRDRRLDTCVFKRDVWAPVCLRETSGHLPCNALSLKRTQHLCGRPGGRVRDWSSKRLSQTRLSLRHSRRHTLCVYRCASRGVGDVRRRREACQQTRM
jgi:hypothetical protein